MMRAFLFSSALLVGSAAAQTAHTLPFASFEQVSQTRVGRTVYQFTYRATATADADLTGVTAAVTGTGPGLAVTDGALSFPDIAAGETVTSTDTFSFRQDLRAPFDPSALAFAFSFEAVTPPPAELELSFERDEANRAAAIADIDGGFVSLITPGGATVAVDVPRGAVFGDTEITLTEITSVGGLPDGVTALAAVDFEPAGSLFPLPLEVTVDLTGLRTPGRVLAVLRSDDDGKNVGLLPLIGDNPVRVARSGEIVSFPLFGFSAATVVEVSGGTSADAIATAGTPGAEALSDLARDFLETALDSSLPDDLTGFDFRPLVDERIERSRAAIADFTARAVLSADDLSTWRELVFERNVLASVPSLVGAPASEIERYAQEGVIDILDLTLVYLAGVHLTCFVEPDDAGPALTEAVAVVALQSQIVPVGILANRAEAQAFADEFGACFSEQVLDAYFEPFDTPDDKILGMTTNRREVRTDPSGTVSFARPDRAYNPAFFDGRKTGDAPLTVTFDSVNVAIGSVALTQNNMLRFGAAGGANRSAVFESSFVSPSVVASAEGTFTFTKNSVSLEIDYFEQITEPPVLVERSAKTTGSKTFTPRGFLDEIADLAD